MPTTRGLSDDIRKRMDDMYAEMEQSWRGGHFHLPLKFVDFHKTDVMFLFVRAAIGYSLAFVKAKTFGKELLQALENRKHFASDERKDEEAESDDQPPKQPFASPALRTAERRERVAQAMEAQTSCGRAMSAAYARLVLHCSNFERHKEDERFFECVYFFVCSVVKLGVAPTFWRPIEEELGFLFRGAHFNSNVRLHAAAAHKAADGANSGSSAGATESPDPSASTLSSSPSRSSSRAIAGAGAFAGSSSTTANSSNANGGGSSSTGSTSPGAKKMSSLSTAKDATARRSAAIVAHTGTFQLPRSRVSHFAPSVPARRIVAELEATKSRAARNMALSQALRDRILAQRGEERRRQLEAITSPRQSLRLDTLDAEVARASACGSDSPSTASAVRVRPRGSLSARLSMKSAFTTHSPVLTHLLPTTEERVRLALRDYEQELQDHREALRLGGGSNRRLSAGSTGIRDARASWLVRERPRK